MMIKTPGGRIEVKENALDKVIGWFSPAKANQRFKARAQMAAAGMFVGASRTRRSTKMWAASSGDADYDILSDLPTLRARSRDLYYNNPLAKGAIDTKVINVVGTGIKLQSRLDRDVLPFTEEQAETWEATTEREWRLFWNRKDCHAARTHNGNALSRMIYRQARLNGDAFIQLTRSPGINPAWFPYSLRLQVIEADRVCNKDNAGDTEQLAGGIAKTAAGAPTAYHVLRHHPGGLKFGNREWMVIPAYGSRTGLPNIIHLASLDRPGQSRGIPDLAPVIEPLKQLGNYTEAELMAAVVSGLFTVFIESESGDTGLSLSDFYDENGAQNTDDDYKLGNGAIVELATGEKIHDSNPGRPNTAFDVFVQAILRQVGVALNLPFEILIKHFTSSYSAARAALLDAWKYFYMERSWLTENFHQVVYEVWMYEAVANGRIHAPGFFTDPILRQAYLGAEWIGPAKGMINEKDEVEAARGRVELGISTLADETAQLTGGDWETKHKQRVKEVHARKADGLDQEPTPPRPIVPPAPPEPEPENKEEDE